MLINRDYLKSTGALRKWIITLVVMPLSLFSTPLACMCIFSDGVPKPVFGGIFHLLGSFILFSYFVLEWRKGKEIEAVLFEKACQQNGKVIIKESLAINILKWLISIYSILFAFLSAGMASICLFGLPDGTANPPASMLFLLSGFTVISILVFTAWKKWHFTEEYLFGKK